MAKTPLELLQELEDTIAQLSIQIETLQNIHTEMSTLRIQLTHLHGRKEAHVFTEQITKVKLLDDLLYYTVNDLQIQYESILKQIEYLITVKLCNN